MKTPFLFACAIIFSLLFIQCGEKESNSSDGTVLKTINGEENSWKIYYDDQLVTRIDEIYDGELETYTLFKYDNDNRVIEAAELWYDDDTSSLSLFYYSEDTITIVQSEGLLPGTTKVKVTDDNLPVDITFYFDFGLGTYINHTMLTWTNGNIVRIDRDYDMDMDFKLFLNKYRTNISGRIPGNNFINKINAMAEGESITTYTFDNKNNPLQSIALQTFIVLNLGFDFNEAFCSKNNPLTMETQYPDDDQNSFEATLSYEYNASDYPFSMTVDASDTYMGETDNYSVSWSFNYY